MRRPSAITFDMGYTLLEHAPTGPDLYLRVLAEHGHRVTAEELEEALGPARDFYVRATREGREFEASMDAAIEFWEEYNALVLDRLGLPVDTHARLGEKIYTEAWSPGAWRLFPEVLSTLEALRRMGIRMAVISNFVDTLPSVCETHGLSRYFDVITASVTAGAMKPDPRIFALTLRRLGATPDEAWHIGDNYWADILGARAAGMTGVLVDRAQAVPNPDGPVIHGLDELLEMVSAADEEAA
jgi:putative hydrolase of the HAD superfamily